MKGWSKRAVLALVGVVPSLTMAAESNTYECKEVSNLAKVGVYAGTIVDITTDKNKKICRFGIGGAEVGSPPRGSVVQGLNGLITGAIFDRLRQGNTDDLAYVLLSSSSETSIPNDLRQILNAESKRLAECFDRNTPPVWPGGSNASPVGCGRLGPGEAIRVQVGGDRSPLIVASLIESVIAVGVVRSGDVAHYLFFPVSRRGGPVFPR